MPDDPAIQQQLLDLLAARRDWTFTELRQVTGREAVPLVRALRALDVAGHLRVEGAPWTRERRYRRVSPEERV